jgi:HD superfamily phosphohydrolase
MDSDSDDDFTNYPARFFSQSVAFPSETNEKQDIFIKPSKIFNDPVHGLITVEYMLVKLIDTPYCQRLRNLAQLGAGQYVFPGAGHNRFQHSLGTMHLAGEMAHQLLLSGDSNIRQHLTDKVILLLKAAALFHDAGHGPLSHCFDNLFIPYLINTSDDEELKTKLSGWEHEDMSTLMVRRAIEEAGLTDGEIYRDPITEDEIIFVQQLINPPENPADRKFNDTLGFCYDILSNSRCSIDVDKFDYLERDCLNAGLRSAFRFQQLISNCKVINNQVCFHKKVAWEVYSLFHTRYSLHKQVYSHRKVKSVEYMITDAMKLADPILQIGRKVLNLENYLHLDDSIVLKIQTYDVSSISNPQHRIQMEKAKEILQRLRRRDLYRYCAESLLPPNVDQDKRKLITNNLVYQSLCKLYPNGESKLTADDIIIQNLTLNYAHKDKNPVDNVLFYNSIYDTQAFGIPSQKVSLLIPSQFSEYYIRIYIRIGDSQEKHFAALAFDDCLKSHLDINSGLTSLDDKHARDGINNHGRNISVSYIHGVSQQEPGNGSTSYLSQNLGPAASQKIALGVIPTTTLATRTLTTTSNPPSSTESSSLTPRKKHARGVEYQSSISVLETPIIECRSKTYSKPIDDSTDQFFSLVDDDDDDSDLSQLHSRKLTSSQRSNSSVIKTTNSRSSQSTGTNKKQKTTSSNKGTVDSQQTTLRGYFSTNNK